jgi:hypothetical protein
MAMRLFVGSKVLHDAHVLGWPITITSWLLFGAVHIRSARLRAAAGLSVRSVVAVIVWSIRTVVKTAFALGMIIAHGKVVGTFLSTIL